MKASYNTETTEINATCDVEEWRCIGLGLALALGGPGMMLHTLKGIVEAADESDNDEDYKAQVDAFFDNIRDEHTETDQQKQIVELLRTMALAVPRVAVMTEHFRQMGKQDAAGASESFNA